VKHANKTHSFAAHIGLALGLALGLVSTSMATVPAKPAVKASGDKPLSADQLRIASYTTVGRMPCELGAFVDVAADAKSPGYFNVQTRGQRFRMVPVVSATGAARLEDAKAGAVWLQLTNKSMLMNQKLGQRLADECKSPAQVAAADAMKQNPGQSVLDTPAAPAPVPTSTPGAVSAPTPQTGASAK
jgi:hypothetical protein